MLKKTTHNPFDEVKKIVKMNKYYEEPYTTEELNKILGKYRIPQYMYDYLTNVSKVIFDDYQFMINNHKGSIFSYVYFEDKEEKYLHIYQTSDYRVIFMNLDTEEIFEFERDGDILENGVVCNCYGKKECDYKSFEEFVKHVCRI